MPTALGYSKIKMHYLKYRGIESAVGTTDFVTWGFNPVKKRWQPKAAIEVDQDFMILAGKLPAIFSQGMNSRVTKSIMPTAL